MKTRIVFAALGALLALTTACFFLPPRPAPTAAVEKTAPAPVKAPTVTAPTPTPTAPVTAPAPTAPAPAPAAAQLAPGETLVPVPSSSPHFSIPEANREIPDELKSCAANMEKIRAALVKYRKDKGRLPDWLTNLVPDYLPAEALFCPNDSQHKAPYYEDPNGPCSYTYEFNPAPADNNRSVAQWKTEQVKTFGDVVPVLRCHCHLGATQKSLNLSIAGQVYWSELNWENMFPAGGS